MILTHRGSIKKMNINEFETLGRAKRGLLLLRELKKNPHRVAFAFEDAKEDVYSILTTKGKEIPLSSASYSISDRYSNGSFILDEVDDGAPIEIKKDLLSND